MCMCNFVNVYAFDTNQKMWRKNDGSDKLWGNVYNDHLII